MDIYRGFYWVFFEIGYQLRIVIGRCGISSVRNQIQSWVNCVLDSESSLGYVGPFARLEFPEILAAAHKFCSKFVFMYFTTSFKYEDSTDSQKDN